MRIKVPASEKAFVSKAIAPALAALKKPAELDNFIAYAVEHGSDRLLFPGRLAKVIRGGEMPTAYVVALLIRWEEARYPLRRLTP